MPKTKALQLKMKLKGKKIIRKSIHTFTPIDKLDRIILAFRRKNK